MAAALLISGATLAVLATVLPVIEVSARGGGLSLTTWQLLPWSAKLKFLALALLLCSVFLPQLGRWRLAMAVGAVAMVFLPAVVAFLAALHAWGSLFENLARFPGQAEPMVHPGLANAVFVAAAGAVSYALMRLESADPSSDPDDHAAAAA